MIDMRCWTLLKFEKLGRHLGQDNLAVCPERIHHANLGTKVCVNQMLSAPRKTTYGIICLNGPLIILYMQRIAFNIIQFSVVLLFSIMKLKILHLIFIGVRIVFQYSTVLRHFPKEKREKKGHWRLNLHQQCQSNFNSCCHHIGQEIFLIN